jgi:hypothetical protein
MTVKLENLTASTLMGCTGRAESTNSSMQRQMSYSGSDYKTVKGSSGEVNSCGRDNGIGGRICGGTEWWKR